MTAERGASLYDVADGYARPVVSLKVFGPVHCANGGLSDRFDTAFLFGPDIEPGQIDPRQIDQAVRAVYRERLGLVHLEPVVRPEGAVGPMFGGCYADGDSRLSDEIRRVTGGMWFYGAVAVHDRFEGVAQYASHS